MRGLLRAAPQATHGDDQNRADEGRSKLDVVEPVGTEPGLEVAMEDRVGDDDLADDPAEQRGACPDQDRITVEQRHDQGRSGHDQRNADGEPAYRTRNVDLRIFWD